MCHIAAFRFQQRTYRPVLMSSSDNGTSGSMVMTDCRDGSQRFHPGGFLRKWLCSGVFPLSLNLEPNHSKALQQVSVCLTSFKLTGSTAPSRGPTPPGPNDNTHPPTNSALLLSLPLSIHPLSLTSRSLSLFCFSLCLLFLPPLPESEWKWLGKDGAGGRGVGGFTADRGVFVCGCRPCPAGVDASEKAANAI